VKRSFALLVGLALLPFVWLAPTADATGGAACYISGTIKFLPSESSAGEGAWSIGPAFINCQGLYRGPERITGPGSFEGAGTYSQFLSGSGTCLHHVGSGKVDYIIPTTEADVHITEAHEFVFAGAGAFTTPSLNGTFQVAPPYEGDCVTKPVTKAVFVAEALLVRAGGLDR
jgi:hypothetical protein